MTKILGISAYYHDSAATLVVDGNIVAAVQEERFSRIKHDPAFPAQAIEYCLSHASCLLDELDAIVFMTNLCLSLSVYSKRIWPPRPAAFCHFYVLCLFG
jgi:carbamoyltransferase